MIRYLFCLMLAASPVRALLPDELNTMKVFADAAPSVVFITNIAVGRDRFMDPMAIPQGSGSGFVWDDQGHIVTNYHVVARGDAFIVTLDDQSELEARLVGAEPRKDIAVLKVAKNVGKLKPLRPGESEKLRVGQKTVAIGNPFGLDHTLTTGVVSALGRRVQGIGGVTIRDMIQTDAAINPGNSGGPLLNSDGELIGMNTMIFSESGSSAGIGFAVPASFIKRIVPQLITHGKVIQPGLGISALTPQQQHSLLGQIAGVVVRDVQPDSPAAKAGLQGISRTRDGRLLLGDILVGIDEHKVKDFDDLYNALDRYKVGDTVEVKLLRRGKPASLKIRLIGLY